MSGPWEAVGFDEESKVDDGVAAPESREIEVETDIEREAAVAVLREYSESGQVIYNGRRDA